MSILLTGVCCRKKPKRGSLSSIHECFELCLQNHDHSLYRDKKTKQNNPLSYQMRRDPLEDIVDSAKTFPPTGDRPQAEAPSGNRAARYLRCPPAELDQREIDPAVSKSPWAHQGGDSFYPSQETSAAWQNLHKSGKTSSKRIVKKNTCWRAFVLRCQSLRFPTQPATCETSSTTSRMAVN